MRFLSQKYAVVPLSSLTLHPENARKGDMDGLKESLDENAFYGAVIVQASTMHILAGNHRFKALQAEGAATVPVILVDVDNEAALRILNVDNRTSDKATYDTRKLADSLLKLKETAKELAGTGYTHQDLKDLLAKLKRSDALADDSAPPTPADIEHPESEEGEIFELGPHRLICGDSTKPETWKKLLAGEKLQMVWTDPPTELRTAAVLAQRAAPRLPTTT